MNDEPNEPTTQNWIQPEHPAQPAAAQGANVPDYLVWSILMTLFCCQPLGIAAIVYAANANSKKASNNIQGALSDAATAKKLLLWGVGLGVAAIVLFVGFYVLMFVGSFFIWDNSSVYDSSY